MPNVHSIHLKIAKQRWRDSERPGADIYYYGPRARLPEGGCPWGEYQQAKKRAQRQRQIVQAQARRGR